MVVLAQGLILIGDSRFLVSRSVSKYVSTGCLVLDDTIKELSVEIGTHLIVDQHGKVFLCRFCLKIWQFQAHKVSRPRFFSNFDRSLAMTLKEGPLLFAQKELEQEGQGRVHLEEALDV